MVTDCAQCNLKSTISVNKSSIEYVKSSSVYYCVYFRVRFRVYFLLMSHVSLVLYFQESAAKKMDQMTSLYKRVDVPTDKRRTMSTGESICE